MKIVDKEGKALQMKFDDFQVIPRGVSQGNFAKKKSKLEDVQVVESHRGSYKMYRF